MHTRVRRAALAALVLALSGCDAAESYRGDGKLVDNGLFAATDRYVLDLGPAALERANTTTYRIENLPNEEFVFGIRVTRPGPGPSLMNGSSILAVVALELMDRDGAILMRREGPLNEWTWNVPSTGDWAFAYGRENPSTYFTPGRGPLRLTLTVLRPDPNATVYAPRIVATTGGWK